MADYLEKLKKRLSEEEIAAMSDDFIPEYTRFAQVMPDFPTFFDQLCTIGSAGVTLAMDVGFSGAKFILSTYPKAWLQRYNLKGYLTTDPIIRWAYTPIGGNVLRWSDIEQSRNIFLKDFSGVFKDARAHSYAYGACVTDVINNKRYLGSCARSDRELTDQELALFQTICNGIAQRFFEVKPLTQNEIVTLRYLADGLAQAEIASMLNLSEQAVKSRLKTARLKLDASNATHAVARAQALKLI